MIEVLVQAGIVLFVGGIGLRLCAFALRIAMNSVRAIINAFTGR